MLIVTRFNEPVAARFAYVLESQQNLFENKKAQKTTENALVFVFHA